MIPNPYLVLFIGFLLGAGVAFIITGILVVESC